MSAFRLRAIYRSASRFFQQVAQNRREYRASWEHDLNDTCEHYFGQLKSRVEKRTGYNVEITPEKYSGKFHSYPVRAKIEITNANDDPVRSFTFSMGTDPIEGIFDVLRITDKKGSVCFDIVGHINDNDAAYYVVDRLKRNNLLPKAPDNDHEQFNL